MRKLVVTFFVVCLLATTALAQAPGQMPKPAPELKRLDYLVGTWNSSGTAQPGPMGPGGKFTGTDRFEWFPGGFFLVMRSDGSMPGMGAMKEQAFFGYDPQKKVYTFHGFNSMGMAEMSTGTVSGKDWTWNSDEVFQGKSMKLRFLMHEESPTSYTMKEEMSEDGGKTWKTTMDGKATKAAAAPKAAK